MRQFRTSLFRLLHVLIVALWVATGVIAPCLCSHEHSNDLPEPIVTVACSSCEPEPEPVPACCANEATQANSKPTNTQTTTTPFTKACQHTSERLNVGHLASAISLPMPDANDNALPLLDPVVFVFSPDLPVSTSLVSTDPDNTVLSALSGRTLPLLS